MLRNHLLKRKPSPDRHRSTKSATDNELSPLPKWLAKDESETEMAIKGIDEIIDCSDNHSDRHVHSKLHKVQSMDAGYKPKDPTNSRYSSGPLSPRYPSNHRNSTGNISTARVPSAWSSAEGKEPRSKSEHIFKRAERGDQYHSLRVKNIANVTGLRSGSIKHSDQFKKFSRYCNSVDGDDVDDIQMDTSANDQDTSSKEVTDPWLDPTPLINNNPSESVPQDVAFSSLPIHTQTAGTDPPVISEPLTHERLWGDEETGSLPFHDLNQNINDTHNSPSITNHIENGLLHSHRYLSDNEPKSLPLPSHMDLQHNDDEKPPLPERKNRKMVRKLGTAHLWGNIPNPYTSCKNEEENSGDSMTNTQLNCDESMLESQTKLNESDGTSSKENGQHDERPTLPPRVPLTHSKCNENIVESRTKSLTNGCELVYTSSQESNGQEEKPALPPRVPRINIDYDPGETNTEELVERYAKKRVSRAHSGRRSVSDLGFHHSSHRIPTPRTAALLNNPSLRKHLSRVLKVDQKNLGVKDFNWNFQLNTSLNPEGSSDQDVSIHERLNMSTGCFDETDLAGDEAKENMLTVNESARIKASISDSQLMCHNEGSEDLTYETAEKEGKSHGKLLGVPPLDLRDLDGTSTPRISSARMYEERKSARALKSMQLQIPSFEEFKLLRRSRTVPNRQSVSPFHRKENRIPEEADNSEVTSRLRSRSLQRRTYSGGDADGLNLTSQFDESGESDASFLSQADSVKSPYHMKPPLPPKPRGRDKSPADPHKQSHVKGDSKCDDSVLNESRNTNKPAANIPPPLLPEDSPHPVVPPRRRKKKQNSSLTEKVVPPLPLDESLSNHVSQQSEYSSGTTVVPPVESDHSGAHQGVPVIPPSELVHNHSRVCPTEHQDTDPESLEACIIAPPAEFSTAEDSPHVTEGVDHMMSKPPLPTKPMLPVKPPLPSKPKRFNPSTKPPVIAKPIISVVKKTNSDESRDQEEMNLDDFNQYISDQNTSWINHYRERSHSTKLQRREAFIRKRSNSEGDDSADISTQNKQPSTLGVPPRLMQASVSLSNSFDESVLNSLDVNDTIEEARRRDSSGEKDLSRPRGGCHHVPSLDVVLSRQESEEMPISDGNGSTSDLGAEEFLDDISPLSGDSMPLPPDGAVVSRSFSDVSEKKGEETRTRSTRERRTKPYKSDPFCARSHAESRVARGQQTDDLTDEEALMEQRKRKCSVTATREDILGFLLDVKQSGVVSYNDQDRLSQFSMDSYSDDEEFISQFGRASWRFSRSSSRRSSGFRSRKASGSGIEVERVDSGVGSEIKLDATIENKGEHCEDCDETLLPEELNEGNYLCKRCLSRRRERKEALQEILTTEVSYGKDLTIIKQEFYIPMKTAGLLTPEQLQTIFCNIDELRSVNAKFADQLRDTMQLAMEQGDEDYITVDVGQLFFAASNMMLAFEAYCVGRADAASLLGQLEHEKELLRIFLHVSQTENSLLRRMGLKAFLMLPVQRVMKYPLLLSRLYKATPSTHPDKEMVRKAQQKVEEILDNINKKTKGSTDTINMRIRQKFMGVKKSFHLTGPVTPQHLHKIAVGVLSWQEEHTECILTGRLLTTQPTDHLWTKKIHTLKFTPVHAILIVHHKTDILSGYNPNNKAAHIAEAAVILLKGKGMKLTLLREAFILSKCVVSVDPECDEVFEIMDFYKDAFLLKSELPGETLQWLNNLRHQIRGLGSWRQRRNALPNIMMHHTSCDV